MTEDARIEAMIEGSDENRAAFVEAIGLKECSRLEEIQIGKRKNLLVKGVNDGEKLSDLNLQLKSKQHECYVDAYIFLDDFGYVQQVIYDKGRFIRRKRQTIAEYDALIYACRQCQEKRDKQGTSRWVNNESERERYDFTLKCMVEAEEKFGVKFGGKAVIRAVRGDITRIKDVQAIVNAANKSLLGGGGVDGAIHRVAGPRLLEECRTLHGCETGEAKITKGYDLPAEYVIHTVGPVWNGGNSDEERLLVSCYYNSLRLAAEYGIKTIAFPSISTGVYGYPVEKAARTAVMTVEHFLRHNQGWIEEVVWVLFDVHTYDVYEAEIEKLHQPI